MRRLLAVMGLLAVAVGRRRTRDEETILSPQPPHRGAELIVACLLVLAGVAGAGSALALLVDDSGLRTRLVGGALALALALLAAACLIASRRIFEDAEIVRDYPPLHEDVPEEHTEQLLAETRDRVSRRRLLGLGAVTAAVGVAAAAIAPALALGPFWDTDRLRDTPWRRGVRLVDATGRPISLDAIGDREIVSAWPEHAGRDQLGSPVVVVRVPPGRVVAYSKICTHAGCAISLYRTPLHEPTSSAPALVCPCHYSAFDPADGGAVVAGPAGRSLPALPLAVAADGTLLAAGPLSGPPGPSWLGVRS